MTTFDLIVIGSGPGGYVTAIRASQLGMKTAVIEKDNLGGVCLNWGCIPTKALLHTAEMYQTLHHLDQFGLSVKNVSFDIKKMVKRSRQVSEQLSNGIVHLLKKNKVTTFKGHGKLLGQKKVEVTDTSNKKTILSAPHIILATGARPRILQGLEPDGKLIWTSKEALTPDTVPEKLVIVGSGAIGMEFASFYNAFGSHVTVIEMQDRILPQEDHEISAFARKSFEKQGIVFHVRSKVTAVEKHKKYLTVIVATDKGHLTLTADTLLVAAGVQGNVENLGLESTKVEVIHNQIQTNAWGATKEPGVHAIGDVAGTPWLAHKASHEGILCVEKIANLPDIHPLKKTNIPACTYTHPAIASVGLTEEAAKIEGHAIRVGRFPFAGNGKAIASGESEGLIKTIFDAKTGELLGAHLIGAHVTELIQGFTIAKTLETTELDLIHTVFPHPTLSEMMQESVLDAHMRVLHY